MIGVGCFLVAAVLVSLIEYVVHRGMHAGWIRGQRHADHHREGWGQGFWPELGAYLIPGWPLLLPPFLLGVEVGVGFGCGAVLYTVFMAYAHQLQHDNPAACRWMRVPVHFVHHRDGMWHHNFGVTVDVWDRLFGTYRAVRYEPESSAGKGPFSIRWKRHAGPAPGGSRRPGQTSATRS